MDEKVCFRKTLPRDLISGIVVFFVALPLCLGIALASNAPLFSGIISGIVGGIVVGILSGSSTSVSGPAAGMTAVVAAQIAELGSFEAFLTAVALGGFLQMLMGIARWGKIAVFFPSSVIKGLLSAIGIILILKQIPHLLGHDIDPMGDKSFVQPNQGNTFSEIGEALFDIHIGAMIIGMLSIAILLVWENVKIFQKSNVPAPLVVVFFGILGTDFFQYVGGEWALEPTHLVQVPVAESMDNFFSFFIFPDFSVLGDPDVYLAAVTIAIVASLATLLNVEAVDKIDPEQRLTPPNRELFAQGVGNMVAGFCGGLPLTSVIVRSSVNINTGVKTKVSAIWHGILLLASVMFVPMWLNEIPLSALAAILLITGFKLATPRLMRQMWNEGKNQFLPFVITVVAIVFTDLLIGVIIGLCVAIGFLLSSNIHHPLKKLMERHATGDSVLHIQLPNQVSFFNRAALDNTLRNVPRGGHVLLDATDTHYIDPDILDLIVDFKDTGAPAHGVRVSLKGFKNRYSQIEDKIEYVDFSNREMQNALTPQRVLEIFKEGNKRFRTGTELKRDLDRFLDATATGQFPMGVVLSCIDSRTPAEMIFDLGLGDIFSVRVAGNILSPEVLGSIEYGCAVANAKLILVMGHTSCGAVRATVDFVGNDKNIVDATGCTHLDSLVSEIRHSLDVDDCKKIKDAPPKDKEKFADEVAYHNVARSMQMIRQRSPILDRLVREEKIAIVGAMYNIQSAEVYFFSSVEAAERQPVS